MDSPRFFKGLPERGDSSRVVHWIKLTPHLIRDLAGLGFLGVIGYGAYATVENIRNLDQFPYCDENGSPPPGQDYCRRDLGKTAGRVLRFVSEFGGKQMGFEIKETDLKKIADAEHAAKQKPAAQEPLPQPPENAEVTPGVYEAWIKSLSEKREEPAPRKKASPPQRKWQDDAFGRNN